MPENKRKITDVVIIGGGAAGLSAGKITAQQGLSTVILERDSRMGGILNQCIHNGFGVHHFKEELTGPEYAERVYNEALAAGCAMYTGTTVMDVSGGKLKRVRCCSPEHGVMEFSARAVVLAMGSRERNRGNIAIAGARPAGVFTAGTAQRLMNINGFVPGSEAVIIGSGDIGLIMARRLSWAGVKVKAVIEIMPYAAGLPRNIAQCLEDFNIPLHLSCQTLRINGRDRVASVDVAPLENGRVCLEKTFNISCDTILMSVGLIPENELSQKAGARLNPLTGGPIVDSRMMTSAEGVFACGNVLHIHDLVDYVSSEAEMVAEKIRLFLVGDAKAPEVKTVPGGNIRYVIPGGFEPGTDSTFYMRPLAVMDKARMNIHQDGRLIYDRQVKYVKPAEMLKVHLPPDFSDVLPSGGELKFSLKAE